MVNRIASLGLGAICVLIALFSTGVLQSNDRLFLEANSGDTSRLDGVKRKLELVKNSENVEVCKISVAKLLRLIRSCEPEVLAEKDKYFSSANEDKQKRCENLYFDILGSCVDRFVNLHDRYLGQYMNETDRELLMQMHAHVYPLPGSVNLVVHLMIKLSLFKKEPSAGKETEEEVDMRLEASCNKARGFLDVYLKYPLKSVNVPLNIDKLKVWDEIDDLCRAHADYLKAKRAALAREIQGTKAASN